MTTTAQTTTEIDARFEQIQRVGIDMDVLAYTAQTSQETIATLGHRIIRAAEGNIESPAIQNMVEADIESIKREAVDLRSSVEMLATLNVGLIELARTYREQRNALHAQLTNARPDFWKELAYILMDVQGCSEFQAQMLVYVLSNYDQDIMQGDGVIGLDNLTTFRDGLQTLLEQLEQSQQPQVGE